MNMSSMFYVVAPSTGEPSNAMQPSSLTKACEEIIKGLKGHFIAPDGSKKPVQGQRT